MERGLCPRCGVLQQLDVIGFRSSEQDESGLARRVITVVYRCARCHTLVKFDEIDDVSEPPIPVLTPRRDDGCSGTVSKVR